jgi:hypothetical protein
LDAEANAAIAAINARRQAGKESVSINRANVDQAMKNLAEMHSRNHAPELLSLANDSYECITKCCDWFDAKARHDPNSKSLQEACEQAINDNQILRNHYKAGDYAAIKGIKKDSNSNIWGS